MVLFHISCPSTEQFTEKRFQSSTLIGELKGKLELITGMLSSTMDVGLYTKKKDYICGLIDDTKPLSAYNVSDEMILEVTSSDPKSKVINFDDPNFERVTLDDEDYNKRTGTVREYLKQNKLGMFSEEAQAKKSTDEGKEEAEMLSIGSRCLVTIPNLPARKGTIKFIGKTEFKDGYWIGVRFDEPVGKNNGSVNGKRYFECDDKFGAFVKPKFVQMGDFPEDTYSDDEM